MTAVKTLSRSFAGGEIAPELYGRLDLTRYQTGLAIARNFVTLPQGPAQNRAGTRYILETKDNTKKSVLLPFSFNAEQTYVLEFGHQYVRFHSDGATVLEAAKTVTSITQAAPGVVTSAAHGFVNGQWVFVTGVVGMTQMNGRYFKVAGAAANTFQLTSIHGGGNVNTTGYGAYVSGGTVARVLEVVTPYDGADLFDLHIAQSADVLTIVHPDYAPRELSRVSATNWTLAEITFIGGPFLEKNANGRSRVITSNVIGNIIVYADDAIFSADDVGRLIYLDLPPDDSSGETQFWVPGKTYGSGVYLRFGDNFYTSVTAGTSGAQPPTHTKGVVQDGSANVYWKYNHSGFGVVRITGFASATQVAGSVLSWLPLGVLGDADGYLTPTGLSWTFSGDGVQTRFTPLTGATKEPDRKYRVTVGGVRMAAYEDYLVSSTGPFIDFLATPPAGVNNIVITEFDYAGGTTDWALGAWGAGPGYPAAVGYFGGRIAYGGSGEEPQDVWLSKAAGDYKDFGTSFPVEDSDAIDVRLADKQVNRVRDLVALRNLVALTATRVWALVGDTNNVLTPAATAEPGAAVGISNVQAEVVGAHALFIEAGGANVRKLRFGTSPDGTEGYVADDLSVLAEHLMRGRTLVDMAYQQRPQPTLWFVRDDGVLLGLTYAPEQEVVAWHRHDTDGFFESVAVVREGSDDVPYFVVRREVNGRTVRYVERMQSRRFTTLADGYFVDAGLSYSGAPATVIGGLHHLVGETVVALADGAVVRDLTVSVEGSITLPAAASKVHVGLPYVADFQTLPLSLEAQAFGQGTLKNVDAVHLRVQESSGFKVGPSFDKLVEVKQRTTEPYGTPPNVLSGEVFVNVLPEWNKGGPVCVRQDHPLPLTIVALAPETVLGG